MTIRSYRDLEAWKCAMTLAEGCYRFTESFPKSEAFGLAATSRRPFAICIALASAGLRLALVRWT